MYVRHNSKNAAIQTQNNVLSFHAMCGKKKEEEIF